MKLSLFRIQQISNSDAKSGLKKLVEGIEKLGWVSRGTINNFAKQR